MMKPIVRFFVIFVLFFMGTTAMIHVDRQCAHMNGENGEIMEKVENTVENTIEKYASLL